jgi:hypothetical protein
MMAMLCLALMVPSANAHLSEFTGEETYGCTVVAETWCWYQGGEVGTTNSANAVSHSYGFQSAEWGGAGNATVFTAICYSTCAVASGTNFRRLCWPNWQHSEEPLDCHDQDGVSGTARVKAGTAGTIRGHALW